MNKLSDITFKPIYCSLVDDVVKDFYDPALSCCKEYKRASAYFDSNILSLYSSGIENIVKNHGHISFVFSSDLKESDYELMKQGYEMREELKRGLVAKITTPSPSNEIKNLAYLISIGLVDIKIALTNSGIFHDKFGLIYGTDGSVLCFRGSNNETAASAEANSESFDTTCSWIASLHDIDKIKMTEEQFCGLWNNNFPKTIVVDIPDLVKKKILSYSAGHLILKPSEITNAVVFHFSGDNILSAYNNLDKPEMFSDISGFFRLRIMPFVSNEKNKEVIFKNGLSLETIKSIIDNSEKMGAYFSFSVVVGDDIKERFRAYELKMENLRALGVAIKRRSDFLSDDFNEFKETTTGLISRPLAEPQLWGAYQIVRMKRAANFSSPGAGKTAIVLGAFAYLLNLKLVDKIVMIGPLNSFLSWRTEFVNVFRDKLALRVFDYQTDKFSSATKNKFDSVITQAPDCNLCLFNYESLPSNIEGLKRIINSKTLLVFDEVHRIKSVSGVRALAALNIASSFGAIYRVVLTGTPIPNGYQDASNFLHILFTDSYAPYFGFDEKDLAECNTSTEMQRMFNDNLFPFFSITTKDDLHVPPADPDDFSSGYCRAGEKEEELFKIVRTRCHGNTLLTYIRLMEASSNPKLILRSASLAASEAFFDSGDNDCDDDNSFGYLMPSTNSIKEEYSQSDEEFIASYGMAPKFYKGIDIVKENVSAGKHVICWALFVDTLNEIKKELDNSGIHSEIICGNVALSERERIIKDFQSNKIDVLIANAATMAESVSLHQNCHIAVYFEYSFNLVHMLQSKDRIHRLGLPDGTKTHYYFMIEDNQAAEFQCIDMAILNRLNLKAKRQKEVLSNEGIIYDGEDLKKEIGDLIGFNDGR